MTTQGDFLVESRIVGPGQPCFIVAEAGVNHDGDLEQALGLVDAAHDAGADAVKFQTWRTEKLVALGAGLADYQRERVEDAVDQAAMLRDLELPYDSFRRLKARADAVGLVFLSTPDDSESLGFLVDLGVPCLKIGSPEVTNLPYLREAGATGLPTILSTGMSSLDEVTRAVAALEETGAPSLALLQCTSAYPTPAADANLRAMDTLAASFPYPVGFSDHTLGLEVAIAAVARGACILEKHLTLDRNRSGPDHAMSLEPSELGELVRSVRRVEQALGDGVKRVLDVEADARSKLRKVIVASRDLMVGHKLVREDVALLRSGPGISPGELDDALGKTLRRSVRAGEALTYEAVR
ncbi:MAG: N-acetylneuraminate synthase family protein [Acidimicrobiales bacterium]